ncbi:hypothetical protein FVEN_g8863 [Fusarium venenatum]|nr:hypothetical protein FVEN_g8863 [Fusarium venenatum]
MENRLRIYQQALEDPSSTSQHVYINRRSSPANQHMIPLMVWTGNVSPHIVAMAEQIMVLLFRTYLSFLYIPEHKDSRTILASERAKFFSSVMKTTATATGWPCLRPKGCNFDSPLFCFGLATDIIAIGAAPGDPNSRALTSYRLKRNLNVRTTSNGYISFTVSLSSDNTHSSGTSRRRWCFSINNEYLIAQRPKYVYLVFEIMNDNKPHPRPWIGMPFASQFENFEQASSLGVHVEWYNDSTESWCKVSLQKQLVGKHANWIQNRDHDAFLRPYYDSMAMIQGLRGLEYTGTLNGHPMRVKLSNPVKTLETLHLSQHYRLQPRPTTKCSAPSRASWDYNFQLMFQKFSGPHTVVGPSTAPLATSGSMCVAPMDLSISTTLGQERRCCDTCYVSSAGKAVRCEPEPGHPHGCCRLCALYNRPCTFTPFSQLSTLWGNRLPHVTATRALARFPNGPFRSLAYHRTMNPEEIAEIWPVQVPLNEKFGVWNDDENEEEEQEGEGEEEDAE